MKYKERLQEALNADNTPEGVCEWIRITFPKLAESEEDETNGWTGANLRRYLSCLQRLGAGNLQQPETINSKWFKEHCHPQPKQGWSKEDEKEMQKLISWLGGCIYHSTTPEEVAYKRHVANWLSDRRVIDLDPCDDFNPPFHLNPRDEVIVQIRKKDE